MVSSFVLTVVLGILEIISVFGIYRCQTAQCLNHDDSHTKLLTFEIIEYLLTFAFLISLIAYMVFVVKKKP